MDHRLICKRRQRPQQRLDEGVGRPARRRVARDEDFAQRAERARHQRARVRHGHACLHKVVQAPQHLPSAGLVVRAQHHQHEHNIRCTAGLPPPPTAEAPQGPPHAAHDCPGRARHPPAHPARRGGPCLPALHPGPQRPRRLGPHCHPGPQGPPATAGWPRQPAQRRAAQRPPDPAALRQTQQPRLAAAWRPPP